MQSGEDVECVWQKLGDKLWLDVPGPSLFKVPEMPFVVLVIWLLFRMSISFLQKTSPTAQSVALVMALIMHLAYGNATTARDDSVLITDWLQIRSSYVKDNWGCILEKLSFINPSNPPKHPKCVSPKNSQTPSLVWPRG